MRERHHAPLAPSRPIRRRAALALLCLLPLSGTIVLLDVAAQAVHCDADLRTPSTNPLGYRLRGDRCEGVYIQEVGATLLRVASLTQSYESFDPASDRPLVVEWTPQANQVVHLRAQSLRSRLYYRMDSIRPAGSASFDWPLDLVATLQLGRNDLGIVAWTMQRLGSGDRVVHLPLRIRQRGAHQAGPYRLLLVPGVQLEEIFLSVAPVGPNGESGKYVIDKQPLGVGYYPAGRPVVIPLQAPAAPGVYRVDIGATVTQGGASATTLYVAHSM